jgi:hypothetical protein
MPLSGKVALVEIDTRRNFLNRVDLSPKNRSTPQNDQNRGNDSHWNGREGIHDRMCQEFRETVKSENLQIPGLFRP